MKPDVGTRGRTEKKWQVLRVRKNNPAKVAETWRDEMDAAGEFKVGVRRLLLSPF